MHLAAANGHTLTCIALSAYSADLDARSSNGRTALHSACWNGHTQTALQLVEMGADHHCRSHDGATPLMDAARNGHEDTVSALVSVMGADVAASDAAGRAPLHYAALNGHTEMVRVLVGLGADTESADNDGSRPLHFASWNGHRETAKMLLKLGANPGSVDLTLSTALHDAAISGRTSTAELLLHRRADVEATNKRGITPLHNAAISGHFETTKLLLDCRADVNATNTDGRTALHFATWNGHPRAVLLLLQRGADMLLSGKEGVGAWEGICHPDFNWPEDLLPALHSLRLPITPMHTAAQLGDSQRVTDLMNCGVDVNCQDWVGDTPMHLSVRNRRLHTSTRLVELGADVQLRNDAGLTVHSNIIAFLDELQQECIFRKVDEMQLIGATMGVPRVTAEEQTTEEWLMMSYPGAKRRAVQRSQTPGEALDDEAEADDSLTQAKKHRPLLRAGAAGAPPAPRRPVSPEPAYRSGQSGGRSLSSCSSSSSSSSSSSLQNAAAGPALLGRPGAAPHSPPHVDADGAAFESAAEEAGAQPAAALDAGMRASPDIPEDGTNPDDPSNCNPDDVHNILQVHPVRAACVQVDAWASNLPGLGMWHSSDGPRREAAHQATPATPSWPLARARASAMSRVHYTCKVLGSVSQDVRHGDVQGLVTTLKGLPYWSHLGPVVGGLHSGASNIAERWRWRATVVGRVGRGVRTVARELLYGKPGTLQMVMREEARMVVQVYKSHPAAGRAAPDAQAQRGAIPA